MRFSTVALAAPLFSLALFAPGAAQAASVISGYNLFVLNNMNVSNGDTEGRVAVKNNASVTSYSVGNSASAATTNFVVGGDLTANGGSAKGSTAVAGSAVLSGSNGTFTTNLLPSSAGLPVDFTAAASYLTQRSTQLAAFANTSALGTVPWGGQFTVNALSAGLNVVTISAAQLATSNNFTINLAAGSKALINVTGTSANFTGGLSINGGSASDVLWNFSDTAALNIQYINMLGSVLAPKATFTSNGGQMHGTLIVDNFYGGQWGGSLELHNDGLYTGDLLDTPPAVPEPASWAMMLMGIGCVGAAMRRSVKRVAFA